MRRAPDAAVPRGPLGSVLGGFLEPVYRAAIVRRNHRFDRGEGVTALHVPVISVGNLSVGGTGKTPVVMGIVRDLLAMGHNPCIAMRGYAKGRASPNSERALSDEADEYSRALPQVSVIAQPDRLAGLRALFALPGSPAVDCVVLDDGFQHRRIARDLDIVLIDVSRSPFEDRLLPAGWLREPVASLRRARIILLTHSELVSTNRVEQVSASVRAIHPRAQIAVTRHEWGGLRLQESALRSDDGRDTEEGSDRDEPVTWLRDRRIFAVCAIGNPQGFLAALSNAGAVVADRLILTDHDPYSPATITRLTAMIRRAAGSAAAGPEPGRPQSKPLIDAVVTTEKDWSKLRGRTLDWPCPVVRPTLSVEFLTGREEFLLALSNAVAHRDPRAGRSFN